MSDREEMQRQCELRALAAEWRRSADEDERYLNKAHASEIHDVYASIRIGREHADALEAAYPAIRQQIAEEIAQWAEDLAAGVINRDKPYNQGFIHASGTLARHAREIGTKEATPDPPKCKRCRGLGYVPDFTNWDDHLGEPKPKPCPDCSQEAR